MMHHIEIDGQRVNKRAPFEVMEFITRNDSGFSIFSQAAKSVQSTLIFSQSAFSLHPSRIVDRSDEEKKMLKEQSVTSLREWQSSTSPADRNNCIRGVSECYRVKKTLFMNQFEPFCFKKVQ